jgi:electron transport complex protein RnfA
MSALVIILLSTVLIQGSALALGTVRPALSARLSLSHELREASFTIITITLSALLGYAITHGVLIPLELEYLRTPALVLTTTAIIIVARSMIDNNRLELRHEVLTLLTNQCALLGVALFTSYFSDSVLQAFVYGLGAAFTLAILSAAFKALIDRIDANSIPFVFRGIPVALISAGLMALALMGFAGIVRN